jgi:hypothetical protein
LGSLCSSILHENYFTLKLSAAVHEAFSKAYPDKEVSNKTIHRLISFWDTESGYNKCLANNRTAEIITVLISSNNMIWLQEFTCYVHEGRV